MFKILYGASNRNGAKLQLTRLLQHLDPNKYTLKLAGYRRSNLYLDWTLDALLDFTNPSHLSIDNDNFEIMFDQIKYFKPDLIISDMDVFVSYAGQLLNKPVWQVSPTLLQHAHTFSIDQYKYDALNTFDEYSTQLLKNVVINSDKHYVYSYLGDTMLLPKLPDNFEWMRPYHYLGQVSLPCQHNIVSAAINDRVAKLLNKYEDVVVFTD